MLKFLVFKGLAGSPAREKALANKVKGTIFIDYPAIAESTLYDHVATKAIIVRYVHVAARQKLSIIFLVEPPYEQALLYEEGATYFDITQTFYGTTYEYEEFDYSATPVVDCIANLKNEAQRKVTREIHQKHILKDVWNKQIKLTTQNDGKPYALVVDVDGTIAENFTRDLYDFGAAITDMPVRWVIDLIKDYKVKYNACLIFITGRPTSAKQVTVSWLKLHGLYTEEDILITRTNLFNRPNVVHKKEQIEKFINDYNILFVLENSTYAANMYRSLGLKVLQPSDSL